MPQEILDYLKTQRIGVLAIEMLDGAPHGSTLHFANTEDASVFYFKTYQEYKKAEPLMGRKVSKASFVVGTTEEEMKTLQLDGSVELIAPEEKGFYDSVYYGKFPEKKDKPKDPKDVFFKFTPTWWRFTDWTLPEGKKTWSSEDV